MSQGEPMVWLTGGMFAIACTMIFALLGFILYQGLATHWQRPYAVYPLNDGGILSGELQNKQPYTISRQSLSELDEVSRANAEALLAGQDQTSSVQLYVRTGNYDVGNRHFAFAPEVTLASQSPFFPADIWLLERREWGVLYGFPRRLKASFAAEHDLQYRVLAVLLNQFDQFGLAPPEAGQEKADTTNAVVANAMNKEMLARQMEVLATKLVSEFGKQDPSTDQPSIDANAMQQAMATSDAIQRRMRAAKEELGRADRVLSDCRLQIRKAELADKTDLQALADECIQSASMKGTLLAQSKEVLESIKEWEKVLANDGDAGKSLIRIRDSVLNQQKEAMQVFSESESALKPTLEALPEHSRRAIVDAMDRTLKASESQYEINTRIAHLEEVSKSQTLELQVPVLESLGGIAVERSRLQRSMSDVDESILEIAGLSDFAGKMRCEPIVLSELHTLLPLSADGKSQEYLLAVSEREGNKATMFKMSTKEVLVSDIVRIAKPNSLGFFGKLSLYRERWVEFLFGEPREAGIEGGFFPAIWGTIVMTLIMSVAVMPFGVIAALFMREYAKNGWVLSLIRISINNLAGVPSIVYGVFGLAFFCYTIGGYVDGGPIKAGFEPWPTSTWFVALAFTTIAGTAAFFIAFMGSGSPAHMSKMRKRVASFSGFFWLACLLGSIALFAKTPFFNGFYEASLPNPTFGKGCLLWASCTLALLTLPVVIVATEEALSAVPNSLREGSYACGAGKWQTLQRIVLPYARPGIITGFILAMARGAGEVAPMMLVGAIPLATDLPLDMEFPFFHGSRSFMHLGFQIYSLGFQSQNSEAAKPMVFTATLLLLTIVTLLNVTAIWLRARLRKRFQGSQF
jgi:phosphate transport system permease protein